jgi:hypothetical protein
MEQGGGLSEWRGGELSGLALRRAYYSSPVSSFLEANAESVLSELTLESTRDGFPVESNQLAAWKEEILVLKAALRGVEPTFRAGDRA